MAFLLFSTTVIIDYVLILRRKNNEKNHCTADGSIDEVRARTRHLLADLIPGICELGE